MDEHDHGQAPERGRRILPGCPKDMVYGPCGGVTVTGGCEVDGHRCPFLDLTTPIAWPAALPRAARDVIAPHREVWVDLRPDPSMEWETREGVEVVAAAGAGVLIGEHLDDPTPHRPSEVARAVGNAMPVIATTTCRGRTDAELDTQIDALVALGVYAVHCVTGDHPAARLGLDLWPTFSRDGTELAARAAGRGARVSVAESPASPPIGFRAPRLMSKQDAGADMAVLNHAGSTDDLIDFADQCRSLGVTLDLVAPVPVITDRRSAAALERFPGLTLPPGLVERILGADDPVSTGTDAAVRMGRDLLDSGRFRGVNLSGSGADTGFVGRARLMARIARELSS